MNRKHTTIAAALLATSALFLGAAHARGPGSGCDGQGPGAMQGMGQGGPGMRAAMQRMEPGAMAERHLDRLKGELKLSGQQAPLWSAYAEKAKAAMGKRPAASTDEKLTAPERMARMQAHMKERVASMEGVNDSFKRLYDSLSADQKAAADQHFGRMGQGGRMQGGPLRGGPQQKGSGQG